MMFSSMPALADAQKNIASATQSPATRKLLISLDLECMLMPAPFIGQK
jgi:hypothetical protein